MGTSERKERERQRRREMIVDAAEAVFFSKGFDNSTMDEIAETAELSKGALYLYFKGKNELCLAIINRSLGLVLERFQKLSSSKLTGYEKIMELGGTLVGFAREHPYHHMALQNFHHHKSCAVESEVLQDTLMLNEEINNVIEGMIIQGVADGTLSECQNTRRVSYTLWGQTSGALPGYSLDDNTVTGVTAKEQAENLRSLTKLVADGLATQNHQTYKGK